MRLTKIYTKTGDSGSTMLASGDRVSKDDTRIMSYGEVDELNAHIGLLRDLMAQHLQSEQTSELSGKLVRIQNELFDIGGELATPHEHLDLSKQQVIKQENIDLLESEMDIFNADLPPLANFVLPGGHVCNSQAHVARTVCRRAERTLVALQKENNIRSEVQIYLNRLSDWLFVVSRVISTSAKCPEVVWQQAPKG